MALKLDLSIVSPIYAILLHTLDAAPRVKLMVESRHLSKAPITEAVVNIQVVFDRALSERDLEQFEPLVIADFPKKNTRREYTVAMKKGGIDPDGTVVDTAGFLFTSQDGKHVIQCKRDGFAFSRLSPYESWDSLMFAAWKPWKLYSGLFGPTRVNRLSTRFINRITMPATSQFEDYLTVVPRLPPNGPQSLASFSSAITIPRKDPEAMTLLRLTFDGTVTKDSTVGTVLDIDVIREVDLDSGDDDSLRSQLESLRQIKNDIFFGSLTEKAVEQYV